MSTPPSEIEVDRPDIFVLRRGNPLTETPLQHGQVWVGEVDGVVHAILTGPIGLHGGQMTERELLIHTVIASIQGCFLSEEFVALMAVAPVDLDQAFVDLSWLFTAPDNAPTTVDVSEMQVPCMTVTYGGVAFAAGTEPREWPFLLARRADLDPARPWPRVERLRPTAERGER